MPPVLGSLHCHCIKVKTWGAVGAQLKYMLGYSIPQGDRLQDLLYNLYRGLGGLRWQELLMGLLWVAILLGMKNAPRLSK